MRPGDSHGHAAWSREGVWKGAEEGNDLKIDFMSYIYSCQRNEPMMKMHFKASHYYTEIAGHKESSVGCIRNYLGKSKKLRLQKKIIVRTPRVQITASKDT